MTIKLVKDTLLDHIVYISTSLLSREDGTYFKHIDTAAEYVHNLILKNEDLDFRIVLENWYTHSRAPFNNNIEDLLQFPLKSPSESEGILYYGVRLVLLNDTIFHKRLENR